MMIDFTVAKLIKESRKRTANPGGGALVSLVGNLGLNILLMMDKKDYEDFDLNQKSRESKNKLLAISKKLEDLMQEDIDMVGILLKAYKDGEDRKLIEKKTLAAIRPPRQTIDLMFEAMEIASFFLEYGSIIAISDGEIGLRLMREALMSSIINIEINQKLVSYDFDKKAIIEKCQILYNKNQEIIERRKK